MLYIFFLLCNIKNCTKITACMYNSLYRHKGVKRTFSELLLYAQDNHTQITTKLKLNLKDC